MKGVKKKKIILLCSGGGHLAEILQLQEMFTNYDYLLITENTPATSYLKHIYNIHFLKSRSNGKKRRAFFVATILINFFLSGRLLLKHFPKVIISTGSHTAIPMCLLGRLFGVKIVYILSYARIISREKTADIIYPIADRFIVQWPAAKLNYEKSIFLGGIF
jgi:beta-1,4-N-acetylglucosaminyltransferase